MNPANGISQAPALLETRSLKAFYGDFQALFGVDVALRAGEIVGLIGANGAGKTTLLRAIIGVLPTQKNTVWFEGAPISGIRTEHLVKLGIAMVPEGRKLFASLTVEENLTIGATLGRAGVWTRDRIYDLFPILAERRKSPATKLSGGQQQMVAIGRALMSNPKVLLCDEISLGFAPVVIADVYAAMPRILESGTSVVVVEQDISQVMRIADRLYCLREGSVVLDASPKDVTKDQIALAYFGMAEGV